MRIFDNENFHHAPQKSLTQNKVLIVDVYLLYFYDEDLMI